MSLAQNGERLFASMGCNSCHSPETPAARGPNLAGVYGSHAPAIATTAAEVLVANDAYLRDSDT